MVKFDLAMIIIACFFNLPGEYLVVVSPSFHWDCLSLSNDFLPPGQFLPGLIGPGRSQENLSSNDARTASGTSPRTRGITAWLTWEQDPTATVKNKM